MSAGGTDCRGPNFRAASPGKQVPQLAEVPVVSRGAS